MRVRGLCLAVVLLCAMHAATAQDGASSSDLDSGSDSSHAEITVISNDNKLHQVIPPPPTVDYATLEEESQKNHGKEWAKKSEEDRKQLAAEQLRKKEKAGAIKREQQREEAGKKEKVEAANKKMQEAQFKADTAERSKAEMHQKTMAKREADEKHAVNAHEQELKKKQQQHDFAEAQRRRDEDKKRQQQAEEAKAKSEHVRLEGGYQNYGGPYMPVSAEVVGRRCFLSGLVKGTSSMIAQLPSKCRPNGRLIFTAKTTRTARVDITRSGGVFLVTRQPGSSDTWISLDGLSFTVETNQDDALQLVGGWRPYGNVYRPPAVTNENGICQVSGIIRSGSWGAFARVPQECAPNGRLIFNGNNHQQITRVDTLTNGYIHYSGGHTNHGWVSLDGMIYNPDGGHGLPLQGNWRDYGYGYRGLQYYRGGPVCVVSGLVRNSNGWSSHITTLPAECRPHQRLIFNANVHINTARVDILPNGEVHYINGKQHWDWLSLSGIYFVV